jgi:hypothetical protein
MQKGKMLLLLRDLLFNPKNDYCTFASSARAAAANNRIIAAFILS